MIFCLEVTTFTFGKKRKGSGNGKHQPGMLGRKARELREVERLNARLMQLIERILEEKSH